MGAPVRYAPESDASFIGLLAALRAGPAAEYSVWLDLVSEAASQLQPVTQRLVLQKLDAGPARGSGGDSRAAQGAGAAGRARGVVDLRSDVEIARRRRGHPELQSCDSIADWHRCLEALRPQDPSPEDLGPRDHDSHSERRSRTPRSRGHRRSRAGAARRQAGRLSHRDRLRPWRACARSRAVQKIFDAKERPATDPLIVHIAHIGQVNQVAIGMPAGARKLALSFWAGPLTLILQEETRGARSRYRGPAQCRGARAVASRGAGVDGDVRHSDRGAEREPLFAAEPDDRGARDRGSRWPRRSDPRRGPHRHRARIHDRRLLRRSSGPAPSRAASPSSRCSRSCPRWWRRPGRASADEPQTGARPADPPLRAARGH